MHACMHACVYVTVCMCVTLHVHLHACVYMHVCMWYTHAYAFALHSYNFIHVCKTVCKCLCVHSDISDMYA